MRNRYSMRASAAVLGLSLLLSAGPVIAGNAAKDSRADTLRHSGMIVAIDQATRAITIEEQGPWYGPGTGMRRVTLRVPANLEVTLAERAPGASQDGWPGSFSTSKLSFSDLRVGDLVTLKAERLGTDGQAVTAALELVRPTARDAEGRTEVPAASPSTEPASK